MERTLSTTPKYNVSVTHHGLHLLYIALDFAVAVTRGDLIGAAQLRDMFERNLTETAARRTSLIATRRAITEAHRDAVKVDGHGTEFISAPLVGTELADAMSGFDETLAKYDKAIAASIAQEEIDENEQGKQDGNLV